MTNQAVSDLIGQAEALAENTRETSSRRRTQNVKKFRSRIAVILIVVFAFGMFVATACAQSETITKAFDHSVGFAERAGGWSSQTTFAFLSVVFGVLFLLTVVYTLHISEKRQLVSDENNAQMIKVMTKTELTLDRVAKALEWCEHHSTRNS